MAKGHSPPKATTGSRVKNAWKLYHAGDMVGARREATAVLADSPTASDAEQAKELIERTRVPRFAWYLAALAAAAILTMIAIGIAHH
jgi:hypothetical protein